MYALAYVWLQHGLSVIETETTDVCHTIVVHWHVSRTTQASYHSARQ